MEDMDYYKINETMDNQFYQLPKSLFFNTLYKDKIELPGKNLYSFLLDRLSLSIKNNWCDEDGKVYLIFTRKTAQQILGVSDKTITKAFKQLEECNLIREKRQCNNRPNKIYIGKIKHDDTLEIMARKNSVSINRK